MGTGSVLRERKRKGRQEVRSKGIDTNEFTKDTHVISKRIMITIGSCRTKMAKDQKISRRKCRKNNSSYSKKDY